MKPLANTERYQANLDQILAEEKEVHATFSELQHVYNEILNNFPFFKPFEWKLIDSKSLQFSIYYETPMDLSPQAIAIFNTDYKAYLWIDEDGWCLDNDHYGAAEISARLLDAPLFRMYPENAKEVNALIDQGFWLFQRENLPSFGEPPLDTDEVLSWDPRFVLVGTERKNMELLRRDQWDALCRRERKRLDELAGAGSGPTG